MSYWQSVSFILTLFKRFGFSLPVLLVVLESFAGIKPATRSTRELWIQLLQITLLSAHLGPKLSHLLHTHEKKHRDEVQALELDTKRVWGLESRRRCSRVSPVLGRCSHLSASSRVWSSASGSGGPADERRRRTTCSTPPGLLHFHWVVHFALRRMHWAVPAGKHQHEHREGFTFIYFNLKLHELIVLVTWGQCNKNPTLIYRIITVLWRTS